MATTNIFNDLSKCAYGAQDCYRNKNTQHTELKGGVVEEIPYNIIINNTFIKNYKFFAHEINILIV